MYMYVYIYVCVCIYIYMYYDIDNSNDKRNRRKSVVSKSFAQACPGYFKNIPVAAQALGAGRLLTALGSTRCAAASRGRTASRVRMRSRQSSVRRVPSSPRTGGSPSARCSMAPCRRSTRGSCTRAVCARRSPGADLVCSQRRRIF